MHSDKFSGPSPHLFHAIGFNIGNFPFQVIDADTDIIDIDSIHIDR